MSLWLDTLAKELMGDKSNFVIEHKIKRGWFMFDVDQTKERTEFIWSKDPSICFRFTSEETSKEFLADLYISLTNYIITDIRKL